MGSPERKRRRRQRNRRNRAARGLSRTKSGLVPREGWVAVADPGEVEAGACPGCGRPAKPEWGACEMCAQLAVMVCLSKERRSRQPQGPTRFDPYECGLCRGWHQGHAPNGDGQDVQVRARHEVLRRLQPVYLRLRDTLPVDQIAERLGLRRGAPAPQTDRN